MSDLRYSVSVYERSDSPDWWARAYIAGEGGKKRRWNTGVAIGSNRRESRREGQRAAESQARERLTTQHEADTGRAISLVASRLLERKIRDRRRDRAVTSLCWAIEKRVLPHFGPQRDVTTIKRAELEAFKQSLIDQGLAPTSINNALTGIRQILKQACEVDQLMESVPLVRNVPVDQDGKGRALTSDEVSALIAGVHPRNEEARDWLVLLANTGLRRTESLAVEWSWIDWSAGLMRVPATFRKGGRRQNAPTPLNSAAMEMLRDRKRRLEERGLYDPKGRVWLQGDHDEARRQAAKRAGLGRVRSHDLRYTAGSLALANGASLAEVRDLLNHSTLAMVNRYAHTYGSRLQDIAERIAIPTPKTVTVSDSVPTKRSKKGFKGKI